MMGLSINARHRGLDFLILLRKVPAVRMLREFTMQNGRFSREENGCFTLTNDGYTMV